MTKYSITLKAKVGIGKLYPLKDGEYDIYSEYVVERMISKGFGIYCLHGQKLGACQAVIDNAVLHCIKEGWETECLKFLMWLCKKANDMPEGIVILSPEPEGEGQ